MPAALPQKIRNQILTLYKEGKLVTEISKIINKPYPTITYILKQEVGYSNPRPSQGDINYFENINSHSKAYILGYIAADGCITLDKKKNLYSFTLVINTKDIDVIYFLKSEIEFETRILNTKPYDKRTNKYYDRTSITLGNQKLCKDLIKLGILQNKTYTLTNILPNIPKEFRKSFILGYFDGDGHVGAEIDKRVKNLNYRTYRISICGTKSFLQGIVEELALIRGSIYESENFCTLNICNKVDFYNFYSCYENLKFYLKRKNNIFLQRINYERTISSP